MLRRTFIASSLLAERRDGKPVNAVEKTYPAVSQFWTYDPKQFLSNPVYSRDFPAAKNLEP